jgi:hypothetical protein
MPKFCTHCGSPVGEEMLFCNSCGGKLETPAPPAAPAEAAPAPPASAPAGAATATPAAVSATPAAPAAAAGKPSPVLKIVLIVVGIFALIAVAGMATCGYIFYRAKQRVAQVVQTEGGGGSITLNTPQGKFKLGQRSDAGKAPGGVPTYPGATAVEKGGEFSIPGQGQISGQDYLTSDSVEQVVEFYKEKLGPDLSVAENDGHYRLELTKVIGGVTSVTTIDVSRDEDAGNTKISIAYMGK